MSPEATSSRPIKVLVVDDEPLARRRIERLLEEYPQAQLAGSCADGTEAIQAIGDQNPDIVFLDVQMPGLTGFEVLESISRPVPVVIFVTAYDQYAVRAFDVHAVDYLLKPFDEDRFHDAFARALEQLRKDGRGQTDRQLKLLHQLPDSARTPYMQRIMVKRSGKIFFLKVNEIEWVEAAGNYARLHVGKDAHLIRETMARIETRLDPAQFLRIHRSTIVNVDRVAEMKPWFSGDYQVVLKCGTELRMSRGYREKLDEQIGSFF